MVIAKRRSAVKPLRHRRVQHTLLNKLPTVDGPRAYEVKQPPGQLEPTREPGGGNCERNLGGC
jgi:hypothetical protein